MSESRMRGIARRRQGLVQRAQEQREQVAELVHPWRAPLSRAERALDTLRTLRKSPFLMLGIAVIVVMRSRYAKFVPWAQRGVMTWRLYQTLRQRWAGGNARAK